jgi:hypothetical protein
LSSSKKEIRSAEEREWIEGELMKIDIALSFLNDVKQPTDQPIRSFHKTGFEIEKVMTDPE